MSEQRLIDAVALKERIMFKYKICNISDKCAGLQSALSQIEKAPTIDAVPVVRCGECRWHDDCICVVCEDGEDVVCVKSHSHVKKSHYCSYGARMDGC